MLIPALFDKSFLQALNPNEAVWFDHFFYPVISPLFYVETLADLEKAVREGRTQEEEVGFIANKVPEMHGGPCTYHGDLCLSELMGNRVPLYAGIPVAGGRSVSLDGKHGIVYDQSPEAKAFARWQEGEFLKVERQFAKAWRDGIKEIDLASVAASMRKMGFDSSACKDLTAVKALADSIVNSTSNPYELLKLALTFLGIPRQFHQSIAEHWAASGNPPIRKIYPFTTHILSIELFFHIGLGAGLIPTRPTNRIDMAYLFYLPFCSVFISGDTLHKKCASYFLQDDQKFIWKDELKNDLAKLNEYYSVFPEEEKRKGLMHLAQHPPLNSTGMVSSLWDFYCPNWRKVKSKSQIPNEEVSNKRLSAELSRWGDPTQVQPEPPMDINLVDTVSIQRIVRRKRGDWWQIPEDISNEK